MRITTLLMAGLGLSVVAAPAMADEMKIYAYPTTVNYCPAGLQPVVLNGVICCGQPTTSVSYKQMMSEPVVRKKRRYSARVDCTEGTKGCS